MSKMFKLLNEVRRDEEGAAMVEYILLVSLIALVAGAALYAVGTTISTKFANVVSCVSSTTGTGC
jgi:pilus assembly protein Flp/PilA